MEITLRKMQHKEDKMQRTASQFQEMEQTVYNSLFTLIKDTSVLRDYAAAALLIINVSHVPVSTTALTFMLSAAVALTCLHVHSMHRLSTSFTKPSMACVLDSVMPLAFLTTQLNTLCLHVTAGVLQRWLRLLQPGASAVLHHSSTWLPRGKQV